MFARILARLVRPDGCVGAEPAESAEHLLIPSGGHDTSRTEPSGDLYRELAGYAGGAPRMRTFSPLLS